VGVRGVNAGLEKSSIFDNVTGRVKHVLAGVFVVGLAPPPYIYSTILGVFLGSFWGFWRFLGVFSRFSQNLGSFSSIFRVLGGISRFLGFLGKSRKMVKISVFWGILVKFIGLQLFKSQCTGNDYLDSKHIRNPIDVIMFVKGQSHSHNIPQSLGSFI